MEWHGTVSDSREQILDKRMAAHNAALGPFLKARRLGNSVYAKMQADANHHFAAAVVKNFPRDVRYAIGSFIMSLSLDRLEALRAVLCEARQGLEAIASQDIFATGGRRCLCRECDFGVGNDDSDEEQELQYILNEELSRVQAETPNLTCLLQCYSAFAVSFGHVQHAKSSIAVGDSLIKIGKLPTMVDGTACENEPRQRMERNALWSLVQELRLPSDTEKSLREQVRAMELGENFPLIGNSLYKYMARLLSYLPSSFLAGWGSRFTGEAGGDLHRFEWKTLFASFMDIHDFVHARDRIAITVFPERPPNTFSVVCPTVSALRVRLKTFGFQGFGADDADDDTSCWSCLWDLDARNEDDKQMVADALCGVFHGLNIEITIDDYHEKSGTMLTEYLTNELIPALRGCAND